MSVTARPGKKRSFFNWKAVVGIILGVLLLWYALRNVDPHEVIAEVKRADPLLYILSVIAATAVFWIRAWRWGTLLAPIAPDTTFRSRLAATTIGFMGNNVLPARVGEFARAYALSRMEKVTMVTSFGSLVVERLFDAVGVIGFLFIVMSLPSVPDLSANYEALANTLGILVIVGFALGFTLVLFPDKMVALIERTVVRFLPLRVRRPVIDALESFLAGLVVLRSPGLTAKATIETVVLWLFNAFGFWLGFRTFGIDIPFTGALLLQSVVALAVSVPSTPGFFGPFEAASVWLLSGLYGIPEEKAVSFALGFHIGGFIPVTLIGLYYAWRLGISIREVEESEAAVESAVERELPDETDPNKKR